MCDKKYIDRKSYIHKLKETPSQLNTITNITVLGACSPRLLPDCTEESLAGICHMRVSPSVGDTPQHYHPSYQLNRIIYCFIRLINTFVRELNIAGAIGRASENHLTVDHVTFREVSSIPF